MKKLVSVLALFIWVSVTLGQALVYKEKLYAPALRDTVSYTVYIPQDWDGWDKSQTHPSIYAINYGMVNGDYVAAQVAYFRKARYAMPNNLVVVVDASMERMGYQYETGELTDEGHRFVNFMKDQLIPAITLKYHTSGFRTYMGHSFAASFGSYLIRTEPGLFGGYILLAPEKTGKEKPFRLSDKALSAYNQHYTFIYSAVGQGDIDRRKKFAIEIGKEMERVDQGHLFFQYDSIARADHTNILTMAIEFALKNIYQFYTPFNGKNETDAFADLQGVAAIIRRYYGLEPELNFTFYSPFAREAITKKDTASLRKILAYFNGPGLKGWNLMQFGEFCLRLNMKDQAARYFNQAITQITTQEMNVATGPPNLLACYWHMAFDICPEQYEKAWGYLLKGEDLIKSGNGFAPHDGAALLYIGKYAAQTGYRLQDGLKYLQSYRLGHYAHNDQAAYYQAKICQSAGELERAKNYAREGLAENPKDSDLINLAKELALPASQKP